MARTMGETVTFEVRDGKLWMQTSHQKEPRYQGYIARVVADAKVTVPMKRVPIEVWVLLAGIKEMSRWEVVNTGYTKLINLLNSAVSPKAEAWQERWARR